MITFLRMYRVMKILHFYYLIILGFAYMITDQEVVGSSPSTSTILNVD